MSRDLTLAVESASQAAQVGIVQFVEMIFDSDPVYLCSAGYNIVWDSKTWFGVGQLGTIDEVVDNISGEVVGLSFTLSGIPSINLSYALLEPYQGRQCNVYIGFLALPNHTLIIDPVLEWSGNLDQMLLQDNDNTGLIKVTAENELIDFSRPRPIMWTNEEQQKRYPGDKGLEYSAQMAERPLTWPSAEYYRR
jgi:hypothetical protein